MKHTKSKKSGASAIPTQSAKKRPIEAKRHPRPESFVIETNRLKLSLKRFLRWLLRQPEVRDAEFITGHLTTLKVKGPTTHTMTLMLLQWLEPERGSALIVRSRGGRQQTLILSNWSNRRLRRIA